MAKPLTPARLTMFLLMGLALLLVFYVGKKLFARNEVAPARPTTRNIVMTIADLKEGDVITRAHIGNGPVLTTRIKEDTLLTESSVIGRVVKVPIKRAETIEASHLYGPGEFPPLDLDEGMTAISISVTSGDAMVDGLIKPNEYVNVHFTPTDVVDERYEGGITFTLLKGVRVLAINRNPSRRGAMSGNMNTVTLQVTPRQSNMVIMARQRGLLTLSHNPNGSNVINTYEEGDPDRITFEELMGFPPREEEPEPPEPEKPDFEMEIYHRSGRQVRYFDEDGKFWRGGGYYGRSDAAWGLNGLIPDENWQNDRDRRRRRSGSSSRSGSSGSGDSAAPSGNNSAPSTLRLNDSAKGDSNSHATTSPNLNSYPMYNGSQSYPPVPPQSPYQPQTYGNSGIRNFSGNSLAPSVNIRPQSPGLMRPRTSPGFSL